MSTNDKDAMDENSYVEKEKRKFQEAKLRKEMRDGKESLHIEDLAENNDIHGSREHNKFKKHDSASDQPTTNTGPGTV